MFNKTRTDFERTDALGHMDALAAAMYGIRMNDKTNPYADYKHTPSIDRFVNPEIIKEMDTDPLAVKVFGDGPKRFGSFAKNGK